MVVISENGHGYLETVYTNFNLNPSQIDFSSNIKHESTLFGREIILSNNDIIKNNIDIVRRFLATKKIEGCSEQTIIRYQYGLKRLMYKVIKPVENITTNDLRAYLAEYQDTNEVSNATLDDVRRIFTSFFNYMVDEDIILKSPARKLHKIKEEEIIKLPFTEEDICLMLDECDNIRDLALLEFLNSTGCRVSEVSKLNINDINIEKREGIVYGKGSKQRIIYFDYRTKIHLSKYLKTRNDNNRALFVYLKTPYNRLTPDGIEYIVKKISKKANVPQAYPHRFRRTLATRLTFRGVPVEQVQRILGHTKIETTLIYSKVDNEDVKRSHTKFSS